MKLVVATRSGHKLQEIRAILRGHPNIHLVDFGDVNVSPSPDEEEIEAFDSFAENAIAKARYFHRLTGLPTVADDSGLVVDALAGAPGVRSKRFSPAAADLSGDARDRENLEHLLRELSDSTIADRTARYVCAAALIKADSDEADVFVGEAEGLILGSDRGRGGFGYDPVFFYPASGKTFAEISSAAKNEISHRGAAFRAMAASLARKDRPVRGGEAPEVP